VIHWIPMTKQHGRAWWTNAAIYELYVDKFAGNFRGLTAKLGYLTRLGINTIHILPHYPSPMVDGGYDISDFQEVRTDLGTLNDFCECVDAAHRHGIRVITDLVLNHVSSVHPWFIEARASKKNAKRDFFVWSDTGSEVKEAPNMFPDIKTSNWIWNEPTGDYYYATFYPEQPDLNWNNPLVLENMLACVDFWVDRGVDGFRLDAVPHLVERDKTASVNLPETHQIVKIIRRHLDDRYGGGIALLAEVGADAEEAKTYFGNGDECQLVYHFELMRRMFVALMRREYRLPDNVLQGLRDIPANCRWVIFLRNHDEINLTTLPDHERSELLDFLDSEHRYPFNEGRATSVRLGTVFVHRPERLIEAFRLLHSLPGVPVIYYGDEIGMQNLPVKEGTRDSRVYVRGNFDWDTAESMMTDPSSLLNTIANIIRDRRMVRAMGA